MGYRDLYVDVDLSDLGDGLYARIRNPMLMAESELPPAPPLTGSQADNEKAMEAHGRAILAKLVVDWKVWDTTSDGEALLPLPKDDPSAFDRLPTAVFLRINMAKAAAQKKQFAIAQRILEPAEQNGKQPAGVADPN